MYSLTIIMDPIDRPYDNTDMKLDKTDTPNLISECDQLVNIHILCPTRRRGYEMGRRGGGSTHVGHKICEQHSRFTAQKKNNHHKQ